MPKEDSNPATQVAEIKVEPRFMGRLQSKFTNRCFRFFIFLVMFLTFSLVIVATANILWRGMGEIPSSLRSAEIWFAIRLSFQTAFISTLLCLIFAVPVAYGLERLNFRGRRLIGIIFDVPMALPPIVSGLALLLLFGTTEFGQMLARHGLKFVFTVNGIVLAQFFVNLPYLIRIIRSTIADINPRFEFVARTLGCSQWQVFVKIILPLAKNGLLAGLVTTWARALGEFGAALMLAGATRMKTEVLPISLYLNLATGDLDLAMAAAAILIVFSLVSLFIFEILGKQQNTIYR